MTPFVAERRSRILRRSFYEFTVTVKGNITETKLYLLVHIMKILFKVIKIELLCKLMLQKLQCLFNGKKCFHMWKEKVNSKNMNVRNIHFYEFEDLS